MTWVDIAIVAVIGLSVLVGVWRGLLKELLALLIWAGALWVAFRFSDQLAPELPVAIETESVRIIIAFAGLMIIALLVGALIGFIINKLVETTGLTGTDRLLGSVFGLARGVALVALAVMLAGWTPFPRDPWWQHSLLLPSFESMALRAAQWLPESWAESLNYSPEPLAADTTDETLI